MPEAEITGPMALRLWVQARGTDDLDLFAGVEKWGGRSYVPFEGSYGFGRDRVCNQRGEISQRPGYAGNPFRPR